MIKIILRERESRKTKWECWFDIHKSELTSFTGKIGSIPEAVEAGSPAAALKTPVNQSCQSRQSLSLQSEKLKEILDSQLSGVTFMHAIHFYFIIKRKIRFKIERVWHRCRLAKCPSAKSRSMQPILAKEGKGDNKEMSRNSKLSLFKRVTCLGQFEICSRENKIFFLWVRYVNTIFRKLNRAIYCSCYHHLYSYWRKTASSLEDCEIFFWNTRTTPHPWLRGQAGLFINTFYIDFCISASQHL